MRDGRMLIETWAVDALQEALRLLAGTPKAMWTRGPWGLHRTLNSFLSIYNLTLRLILGTQTRKRLGSMGAG